MNEGTESALTRAVSDLNGSIDKLRDELVRKDVYTEQRQNDRDAVAVVVDDVKEIKDTLRWLSRSVVASLVIPLLSSAVMVYVSQQVAK